MQFLYEVPCTFSCLCAARKSPPQQPRQLMSMVSLHPLRPPQQGPSNPELEQEMTHSFGGRVINSAENMQKRCSYNQVASFSVIPDGDFNQPPAHEHA